MKNKVKFIGDLIKKYRESILTFFNFKIKNSNDVCTIANLYNKCWNDELILTAFQPITGFSSLEMRESRSLSVHIYNFPQLFLKSFLFCFIGKFYDYYFYLRMVQLNTNHF